MTYPVTVHIETRPASSFECAVNVAEHHARRALAAGRNGDAQARERHASIMRQLIEGSEYPGMAEDQLSTMLGRSRAAALKLQRPLIYSF